MIKYYLNKTYVVALSLLLLGTSCGDADLFDTDKWSDNIEGLEPNMRVKIAHGSFTLWDLLMDSTGYIQKIPDSQNSADTVLAIKYTEKDIYQLDDLSSVFDLSVDDLVFTMPEFEVPGVGTTIELTKDLDLGGGESIVEVDVKDMPEGCELKEIVASAQLLFSTPRQSFVYEITVSFDNLYVGGLPFSKTFKIEPANGANGTAYKENINFNGVTLNLRETTGITMNVSALIKKGQTVIIGTKITGADLKLSDLNFIKAVGKLNIEPMKVNGDFNLDIEFLDKIDGNFHFAEPELKILVKNKGIGVAANLQMDFWVKDGIGANRFHGAPLVFPVNKNNTIQAATIGYKGKELADFLSLPPTGLISYEGEISASGSQDGSDVIWKDGSVNMDAEITIPLKLSADNLVYRDTISDISVDANIADKIQSASITLDALNGVPLELALDSLTLVDANYNVLAKIGATKGNSKLEAANGKTPAKGKLEFGLTKEQAKLLGRSEHIILDIKAATVKEGDVRKSVTIYSNATLDLNVILNAQVKINNFDF